MAGSVSEDYGVGKSSEEISHGQHCQSGEALAEWRSCEQVENGTPSTSPPYWDTDDDDEDCGAKPSGLYGKFTWKVEKFSQITKRELRSNVFEVGGYKWYILIYPQGCDVCNHLSLFLCVANHDKLLPGWGHFAQFTIAVVNKDPKKSKYSDTLHRFWKKEHDWGWKKFMELSKVLDGFVVADNLVIKAQVQVIREKADRPFRCLDCLYRRELVRVYLTNVEQICRRFVEERRGKLGKLIEDKARWSSLTDFWLGVDQHIRRRLSREKTDAILKVVVKQFFIEKEVTSTLVMDSLYSGLKALECQGKSMKGNIKLLDTDKTPAPIVRVEKDMFVLVDDVLPLLERAALEPLPPKDEKGPQNRTKDGSSGEDFNKDSIEHDERRLTELGRRTVEIFVLAHIFSNRIEVAYQEAVALKRQEELIREEEAAGQVQSEQKSKRGAAEKEKRSKKKQGKHKRKGKDKRKDEKSGVAVQDKQKQESYIEARTVEGFSVKLAQSVLEKPDTLERLSDVSDTGDDVAEMIQSELEDGDTAAVDWDAGTSEVDLAIESNSSGTSGLPLQNGWTKKCMSVMDDSSSTCSTDSTPSVVQGPHKGNFLLNYKSQTYSRGGKDQRGKQTRDSTALALDTDNQPSVPVTDTGCLHDVSHNGRAGGSESGAVLSLKDRIQWLEQHLVEKEEVVTLQKKLDVKDPVDVERPSQQRMAAEVLSCPSSPTRNPPSSVQPQPVSEGTVLAKQVTIRETSLNGPQQVEKAIPLGAPSPQISISKPEVQKPATPNSTFVPFEDLTALVMSRPSSAPLIPAPKPSDPIVSMVQTAPSLARSVSATERLGTDPSPATHSYFPHSYRNAIMGKTIGASPGRFTHPSSSVINQSPLCSGAPPALLSSQVLPTESCARKDQGMGRSGFPFGAVTQQVFHNKPPWVDECSRPDASRIHCDPSLLSDFQNLDIYSPSSSGSRTHFTDELPANVSAQQAQGVSADDFPHLDIINYLLDEEHYIGRVGNESAGSSHLNNGHHHSLNRQFTFPGDMAMSADINCCRFGRQASYHDYGLHRAYGSSSGLVPQVGLSSYANEHVDGVNRNQWPVSGAHISLLGTRNTEGDEFPYQVPNYSDLVRGIDGYTIFQPSNGH